MLERWFGHNAHYYIHLVGLSGVAVGLPLSKVILSISTLLLVLNLLLKGDFKSYFTNYRSNTLFLFIAAFYFLHCIGLLWTTDMGYGLHDIWKKLPLLLLPAAAVGIPVRDYREKNLLLLLFVLSTFITSLINYLSYHQVFGHIDYDGFRDMSLFGSHIRYSLLIVISAGICYFMFLKKRYRLIFLILIGWFIHYTLYSQVISGFLALSTLFITIVFYHLYAKRKLLLGFISIPVVASACWLVVWFFQTPEIVSINDQQLEKFSAEGNQYHHDFTLISPETNKPIGLYVVDEELRREWNNVSHINYDSLDERGQPMHQTLKRYMASRDLRKDAEGFDQLSKKDIRKIEDGCASIYCQGILARVYGLKYQILNEKNPNGHSLLQRLEYWKAGIHILSNNFIIGVGTGDVQKSFDAYYEETYSPLNEKNRCRAHNNYLTVFLTLGIPGILLFIGMHLTFLRHHIKRRNLVPILFISIAMVSYLLEDTLETQVGITFFAFFYAIYSPQEES